MEPVHTQLQRMPVTLVFVVVAALAITVQEEMLVTNVQQESTRQHLLIQRYLTVAIVALAIIVQEELLVINVHQESTRQQPLIQRYLTVVIVALDIIVQEVVLE